MILRVSKKSSFLACAVIFFFSNSVSGFSIDGKTLSELASEQRFSLSKRVDPEGTNISLRMRGRDLQVGAFWQADLATQITDIYSYLESQREKMATLEAEEYIKIIVERAQCFKSSFTKSGQSIFIKGPKIELDNSIVQAGDEIQLAGSEFKFENAFFSCKKGIRLEALPESKGVLRSIKYIFSDKNPFGCFINGSFKFQELPVITSDLLLAFGAQEVILEFDQNLSP